MNGILTGLRIVEGSAFVSFMELVRHDPECTSANPMFQMVEQPGIGTYLMPASPLDFGAAPRLDSMRAPLLGEHTDEILASVLGLSDGQIGQLHDTGIVGGPDVA